MIKSESNKSRLLKRLLVSQLLFSIPIVLFAAWLGASLGDRTAASLGSALLGCLIAFFCSSWFLVRATSESSSARAGTNSEGAGSAEFALLKLYGNQLAKMVTAGLLLGLSLKYGDKLLSSNLDPVALTAAFCIAWFTIAILQGWAASAPE